MDDNTAVGAAGRSPQGAQLRAPTKTVPEVPAPKESEVICWCCGGETVKHHCKIVCTNCGFMRDCSDP